MIFWISSLTASPRLMRTRAAAPSSLCLLVRLCHKQLAALGSRSAGGSRTTPRGSPRRRRRRGMAAEEAKHDVQVFDGQVPSFLIDDDKYKALKAKRQEAMSRLRDAHEELFKKMPEMPKEVEGISREDPPSWEELFAQQQEIQVLVNKLKERNRKMYEDKDEYYRTVEQMNAKMDSIEKVIEEKKPLLEAAQKLVAEEKALEAERVNAMGDDERAAWDASEHARVFLEESEKSRKAAEQAEAERWASLTESERQAEEKEKRRLAAIAAEEEEERRLQQEEDDEW